MRYKELSDEKAEAMEKVVESRDLTVKEAAEKIDKIETKLKFQAFGKSSIKGTQGGGFKSNSSLREDQAAASSQKQTKNPVAWQISATTQPSEQECSQTPVGGKDPADTQPSVRTEGEDILARQSKRLEREIKQIKSNGRGKCGQIFKIAEAVQGPKKPGPEAHSVVNPKTGELVVATKEIQKVFLNHCKDVLEVNPVEEGFEQEIELREKLHDICMKETSGEFLVTEEAFERVITKFKANNKRNYDFLVRGGDKFKHSIYLLVKRMIEDEEFGESFGDTTLYNIYKGKGKKEDLESMRFIHSKSYLPRTVEAVVVEGMKEDILAGSSCYQIGGQPGHRSQEHLFTVKSVIAKVIEDDKAVIGGVHDIQKFFDKEVLSDVLNTLTEMKVNPKCVRVWGKLNQKTRIRVRCGGGYSPWMEVGDTLGQGSGGAALASQANLDKGITSMFLGSSDLLFYGTVPISPLLFQDDIFSLAGTVNSARSSLDRVNIVMKQKQLRLHKEKTSYILFGSEAQKEDIRKKLTKEPLVCGNFQLKEKDKDKYLGEIFHSEGLARSALETIKARSGKIKAVSYEIKAIMEDYRAEVVGGALCGLELWQLCALPSLLSSCSTWLDITPEAIEEAEQLQLDFLRLLFKVPKSCPRAALRSESGVQGIKYQIMKQKLLLLFHIRNLDDKALAKRIYLQQLMFGWAGPVKEGRQFCEELGIPDVTVVKGTKQEFKAMVKEACRLKDEMELKENILQKEKLQLLKEEDCTRKQYIGNMTLSEARILFQHRTNMTKNAGNYKGWAKYKEEGALCKLCQKYDSSSHLMRCEALSQLKGPDFCLNNDAHLVQYLRQALKLREDKEKELEKEKEQEKQQRKEQEKESKS